MLVAADPDKAVELLKKMAKKDDSAKLVLGDYYLQKENYREAYAYYDKASLPAARSAMGKRYLNPGQGFDVPMDTSSAKDYFEQALELGKDTTANLYLGLIALNQFKNGKEMEYSSRGKKANWETAAENFAAGIDGGCVVCKEELGKMNFIKGNDLYVKENYDLAYPYLVEAARYENVGAMGRLAYMFNQKSWKGKYNRDSSVAWCRSAMRYNYAYGFHYYAFLLLDSARSNPFFYDSVYYLLHRSMKLDPSPPTLYNSLGEVFKNGGYKISANRDSAIYYYRKAAGMGLQIAKDTLQRLEETTYLK